MSYSQVAEKEYLCLTQLWLTHIAHTGLICFFITMPASIETGGGLLISDAEGRRSIELITAIYKAESEERTINRPSNKMIPSIILCRLLSIHAYPFLVWYPPVYLWQLAKDKKQRRRAG